MPPILGDEVWRGHRHLLQPRQLVRDLDQLLPCSPPLGLTDDPLVGDESIRPPYLEPVLRQDFPPALAGDARLEPDHQLAINHPEQTALSLLKESSLREARKRREAGQLSPS